MQYKYLLYRNTAVLLSFAIIMVMCTYANAQSVQGKIPVLMYHHILRDEENVNFKDNACTISLDNFKEQIKYLYDNGFTAITSAQLIDYLYDKKPLPEKSIMLTFDDGYYSNIIYAYPILKEYNFKAVIFAVTNLITDEIKPFDPDELTMLNKIEMAETTDVFEYASHTDSMHYMSDKRSALEIESKENIISDIKKSLEIKEINNKSAFSYPYGKYNDTAIACLKDLGVKYAVTVKKGYVGQSSDPYKLNRFDIFRETTFSRFQKIVNLKAGG